jgi:hypothetical protein
MKRSGAIKVTLDNKHNEIIKSFKHNEEVVIPKYLKQIEKYEAMMIKSKNKVEILEIISKTKNIINALKNKEKNYYLNNSRYIFDYFENKKNISANETLQNSDKNNIVKQFFSLNIDEVSSNDSLSNECVYPMKNTYSDDKLVKNDANKNIDKYFNNIDPNYLNYDKFIYPSDICNICKNGELIFVESEGMTICSNCSNSIKYLIDIDKPSYKEPPKEVCSYAYKRINHLKEILAQFQAKESTNIPDEVFENIKNQIKKERISLSDLTNKKTKEILKNLGYNKYYEHIPFIKDKLGIRPPIMSAELEETLCNLFMELQKPYSKYCPKDRVNFLNYYYTLYKLCELLNERSFLPYFPMLKDREKRIEQDQIWKKICEDLGWKFIPIP